MDDIGKTFGATRALRGVSLDVHGGEVLALIGENGAGKSTLMKVLSGAHLPDSGTMSLAGKPYRPQGPQEARRAGVAMIYQELNLAPDLSVEDNIMLGFENSRFGCLCRREQRRRVHEALSALGHAYLNPKTIVGQLSVGAQQLVEIARAIVFDARLIVFDEPTSSLPARDVANLFRVIHKLRDSGRAIVYISHFLEEVREIADRFTVLRDGESAGTGNLADTTDEEIVSLMVGRSVDDLFPQVDYSRGELLLSIRKLSGQTTPTDVSLDLHGGEIVGIAGLVGAGRTELLRCIFGLDPVRLGAVRVAGITRRPTPRAQIAAGLGFVSEDRKSEGLAQSLSIIDNMTLSRLSPYSRGGWLRPQRMRVSAREWMKRLEIKARHERQAVEALSGGNQQKVAIARVLHQAADVLLLDEEPDLPADGRSGG
jgi:ribose transport system ATP-binding protein